MNLEYIFHQSVTLTETPGAGAKQEVCNNSMQRQSSGRTFHRCDPLVIHRPVSGNRHDWEHYWRATHVFIVGKSNVDRMRGDSSSE
ncbi:hypothetical protein M405DRAFT_830982 [Rhizopogon salebrosus TDB-379]|nr:hypothetical protein M405DRAFT_830982 [Rhizopogon salebrosus TDB-379]